jgi:hypothetical protein
MVPVLVFFGVATLVGLLIGGFVRWRLRSLAGERDASDPEVCQLRQASRISSAAVIASLVGLAAVGLALVLL